VQQRKGPYFMRRSNYVNLMIQQPHTFFEIITFKLRLFIFMADECYVTAHTLLYATLP